MTKPTKIICVLVIFALAMTGCNLLSVDLDRTYNGATQDEGNDLDESVDLSDESNDSQDVEDDTPDLPLGKITLRMTELMINSTQLNPQDPEAGEFIEIYNAGERAIDLKNIKIQAKTNDTLEHTIEGIKPFGQVSAEYQEEWDRLEKLNPGEYFVFVHANNPVFNFDTIPNERFYSWHWPNSEPTNNKSLVNGSNEAVRRLELLYSDDVTGETTVEHTLTWRNKKFYAQNPDLTSDDALSIEENISFSLNQTESGEIVGDANLVTSWCLSTKQFATAIAHGDKPFIATPGESSPCPVP